MLVIHDYYDSTGKFLYSVEEEMEDVKEVEAEPTQLDILEAQVTYTAMMTDTLLEV